MHRLIWTFFLLHLINAKNMGSKDLDDCRNKVNSNNEEYDLKITDSTEPVKVQCNLTSGASSTVIQRRVSGAETFNRGWDDYKSGFGNVKGNYWIGLDVISHLTSSGFNTLRIDMEDWARNKRYAQYKHFVVQDERNFYRMTVSAAGYEGNVPDDFSYHSGNYFFTPERPDQYNCARNMNSGWWFYYCAFANLNGVYYLNGPYNPNPAGFYDGIYWKDYTGFAYSLKSVSMTLIKT